MDRNKVLLVEDDAHVRVMFRDFLSENGYIVQEADSATSATRLFQTMRPDVTVTDYELPDGNALELLPRFKAIDPTVPFVIMSAYGTLERAVQAGRRGAERFLAKPVPVSSLRRVLRNVLEGEPAQDDASRSTGSPGDPEVDPFLGSSGAMRQLRYLAEKLRRTHNPVLIQGETGTGKGVLARWLHRHGPRAANAFVDLNCAGLSTELLDTELFGHVKGAFTSATSNKTGLLEVGHRGTVFLDEVGDMPLPIQGRLLKAVEEKSFRRLGDVRDRRVDTRLIAASNRDLWELVKEDRFRSDFYHRIAVFPIQMPPLRQRVEDIPVLAQTLLERLALDLGQPPLELTPASIRSLQSYSWPGNIRQLKNVLERASLMGEVVLDCTDPNVIAEEPQAQESDLTLSDLERRHISRVLEEEDGHVARAAVRLGVPRSTLYQKLKKLRSERSRSRLDDRG